ncbi:hypothetical protein [Carboxylicivirga linearis]|uniref:Uncharacterized protein n=1 Tax=Carboxylicivirga linearis TaxID=1628157 RepID=A0ABS5JW39_9BACT|nr:hypothetical protein [Carboxylicivirga linearis]MBS2099097.1 hypothetical protein [Carboxylicivirga linearis]
MNFLNFYISILLFPVNPQKQQDSPSGKCVKKINDLSVKKKSYWSAKENKFIYSSFLSSATERIKESRHGSSMTRKEFIPGEI